MSCVDDVDDDDDGEDDDEGDAGIDVNNLRLFSFN